MIYYDKIKVIGSDSSGRSIAVVSLWVDSAASLPAANAYQSDGFILGMGSEGNCIDSGDKYRLDSSGAWQITQAGTGTYTKSEIDTLLAAKQPLLTFDTVPTQDSTNPVTSGGVWSPFEELIDTGSKNKFQITGSTSSPIVTVNADQTVTVNGTPSSGNISFTMGQFTGEVGKPYHFSGCPAGGSNNTWRLVLSDVAYDYGEGFYFVGDGLEHNVVLFIRQSNDPVNITAKPMICTKAAWDISHEYKPYCPSMQRLYQMILALQ